MFRSQRFVLGKKRARKFLNGFQDMATEMDVPTLMVNTEIPCQNPKHGSHPLTVLELRHPERDPIRVGVRSAWPSRDLQVIMIYPPVPMAPGVEVAHVQVDHLNDRNYHLFVGFQVGVFAAEWAHARAAGVVQDPDPLPDA